MFLSETLDVKSLGLVAQLYSDQVISALERDDILAEKTSFRANEKLLSVLSRKSPQQFQLFLHALDKCGQSHVRNVIADQTDQTGQTGLHLYLPGKSEKEGDTAVSSLNINRFWKFFHSRLNCKSVTKLLLWIPPHSKRLALIPTLLSYHLSTLPLYHFNNLTLCNNLFISFDTTLSSAYCQLYSIHSKPIARRSACNRDQ